MKVVGIDGCKRGWFALELSEHDWSTNVYRNISEVWENHRFSKCIIIDIPLGMRNHEKIERKCDLEARKILGPGRGSSVFPVPCRSAVNALTYEEAHHVNKEHVGRGLSKQTWGIIPKIKEVDELLRNESIAKGIFFESHPEVAFWALNGKKTLMHNKKSDDGINERLRILSKYDTRIYEIYESSLKKYSRKDVTKDDVVDAICMAITGLMVESENYITVPDVLEEDGEGIEMKIVCYGGHQEMPYSANIQKEKSMTFRYDLAKLAVEKANYPFHGNTMGLVSNLQPIADLFPKWDLDNWDHKWCAAFVYYCCIEAGYKIPVRYSHETVKCNFAGCSAWEAWASLHDNGFFFKVAEKTFEPSVGDIVLYDNVFLNQEHDHIGIIVEVHHEYFKVAEGNIGNISAVVRRPRYANIRGFIRIPDNMHVKFDNN